MERFGIDRRRSGRHGYGERLYKEGQITKPDLPLQVILSDRTDVEDILALPQVIEGEAKVIAKIGNEDPYGCNYLAYALEQVQLTCLAIYGKQTVFSSQTQLLNLYHNL